jgi:hypothetical protein
LRPRTSAAGSALETYTPPVLRVMRTVAKIRASRLRRRPGLPVTVQPTKADISIARGIARDTKPAPEEIARVLTWGADEKVLLVLAAPAPMDRLSSCSFKGERSCRFLKT